MITLNQIIPALISLGVGTGHIQNAVEELNALQADLEEVEVKGRERVDTLLGCMMAIDAIIGKDGGEDGR